MIVAVKYFLIAYSIPTGALFSTIAASDNILRISGSALFNPLYGYTVTNGIFKGTAFTVMAGFVTIGLGVLL